jgi:hypothetical protein
MTNIPSPKPKIKWTIFIIIVLEVLALPIWFISAMLNSLGFSSAFESIFELLITLIDLLMLLYPLFILIFSIKALRVYKNIKNSHAILYAAMPLIIWLGLLILKLVVTILWELNIRHG